MHVLVPNGIPTYRELALYFHEQRELVIKWIDALGGPAEMYSTYFTAVSRRETKL